MTWPNSSRRSRRWRWQFRYGGSRRESAVTQLFSLGSIYAYEQSHSQIGGLFDVPSSRLDLLICRFSWQFSNCHRMSCARQFLFVPAQLFVYWCDGSSSHLYSRG